MAERIYPSAKPTANAASTTTATTNNNNNNNNTTSTVPSFPATKSQLYNAQRPIYRPQPPKPRPRRSRRSCCCCCFLWTTLFILALIFLAAIAGGIFYLIYRPHRPSFSLSSARLTPSSHLNLTISARNPNKKLSFLYAPISVSTDASDSVEYPAFEQEPESVTVVRVDPAVGTAAVKGKKDLTVTVTIETKVGVKVGSLKTKKVGVSVICDGVTVAVPVVPKGKNSTVPAPTTAASGAACKVKLRVKIWKWNL